MTTKPLNILVAAALLFSLVTPVPPAHAQELLGLPEPGAMVSLSPAYSPAILKGVTVHKDNPFMFDFIVDVGQERLKGDALKQEGEKLIKYFLASLAIPEKDLWVNLSPYEKDRTIPQALSQTEMGRDLLAQDYILKQLTASLIYPEKQLGKTFWDKVYSKTKELYGPNAQIPVNTFNKVWIMADKAEVFEKNNSAFVVDSHLKVMLEEDYLALTKNNKANLSAQNSSASSKIIKEIILPELEREVNTGKNFAPLRQIFNSLILASWYKNSLKNALLNQVYSDKSTVKGIDLANPNVKEEIYQRYLSAYKKGVFNFIKEDTSQGKTIPRKYFSGGVDAAMAAHPTIRKMDPVTFFASAVFTALVVFKAGVSIEPPASPEASSHGRPAVTLIRKDQSSFARSGAKFGLYYDIMINRDDMTPADIRRDSGIPDLMIKSMLEEPLADSAHAHTVRVYVPASKGTQWEGYLETMRKKDAAMTSVDRRAFLAGAASSAVVLGTPGASPVASGEPLTVVRGPSENNVVFMEHEVHPAPPLALPLLENRVKYPSEYIHDNRAWETFARPILGEARPFLAAYKRKVEILKEIVEKYKIGSIGLEMSSEELGSLTSFAEKMDRFKATLKDRGVKGADEIIDAINLYVVGPGIWLAKYEPGMGHVRLVALESDTKDYSFIKAKREHAEQSDRYVEIQHRKQRTYRDGVIAGRIVLRKGNFLALLGKDTIGRVSGLLPEDRGILKADGAMVALPPAVSDFMSTEISSRDFFFGVDDTTARERFMKIRKLRWALRQFFTYHSGIKQPQHTQELLDLLSFLSDPANGYSEIDTARQLDRDIRHFLTFNAGSFTVQWRGMRALLKDLAGPDRGFFQAPSEDMAKVLKLGGGLSYPHKVWAKYYLDDVIRKYKLPYRAFLKNDGSIATTVGLMTSKPKTEDIETRDLSDIREALRKEAAGLRPLIDQFNAETKKALLLTDTAVIPGLDLSQTMHFVSAENEGTLKVERGSDGNVHAVDYHLRPLSKQEMQAWAQDQSLQYILLQAKNAMGMDFPAIDQLLETENRLKTAPADELPFTIQALTFPSPVLVPAFEKTEQVYARYFLPKGEGKFPVAVIASYFDQDPFARFVSLYLATHGVAVLEVGMPLYGKRSSFGADMNTVERYVASGLTPQRFKDFILQSMADTMVAVRWAAARPEIDASRLAVTGQSVTGSIVTGVYLLDPQVQKLFTMVPVVNYAHLLWTPGPRYAPIQEFFARQGITPEAFSSAIQDIYLDRLAAAHPKLSGSGTMVIVDNDELTPKADSDALLNILGPSVRQERSRGIEVPPGPHLTGSLQAGLRILPQFLGMLKGDPARAAGQVTRLYYIGSGHDIETPVAMAASSLPNVRAINMIDPLYQRDKSVLKSKEGIMVTEDRRLAVVLDDRSAGTFEPLTTDEPAGYIVKVPGKNSAMSISASFYASLIKKMHVGDYLFVSKAYLRNDVLGDQRSGLTVVPSGGGTGLEEGKIAQRAWGGAWMSAFGGVMDLDGTYEEIPAPSLLRDTDGLPYVEKGWVIFEKTTAGDHDFIEQKIGEDRFEEPGGADKAMAAKQVTRLYYIGSGEDHDTPANMVNGDFSNVREVHMVDPVHFGSYVAPPFKEPDVHTRVKAVRSKEGKPVDIFFENREVGTFEPPKTTQPVGYIVKVVGDSSSATAYASFYAKMVGKMKEGDYLLINQSFLRNDILEDGRSGLTKVPAAQLGLKEGVVRNEDWTTAVSLSSIMLLEMEGATPKLGVKELPYVDGGWVVFRKEKGHDRRFIDEKSMEDIFETGGSFIVVGGGGANGFARMLQEMKGRDRRARDPVAIYAGTKTRDNAQIAQGTDLKGKRVLIVEDDVNTADAIAGILYDAGAEAMWVETAEDALDVLAIDPVDIILSDLHLPHMDGVELAKEVKATSPGMKMVIWSEGYPDVAQQREALGLGVEILSKQGSAIDVLKHTLADQAMAAKVDEKRFQVVRKQEDMALMASPTGGIDLNTGNINWVLRKGGDGVEMDIDPAAIERIRAQGIGALTPVIFSITPVADVQSLLP